MDLKIKDVAELLNVSETTIRRWLTEEKIPAYRINHQFRFSRIEIEEWVMSNKLGKVSGNSPFNHHEQVQQEPAERLQIAGSNQYSLYRAIHNGDVIRNVPGETKEEIIRKTMQSVAGKLNLDAEVITDLLLDREYLQPTALGNGIAVPHTRDFLHPQDVVTIAFPEKPIHYDALDGKPVHTLFFLFGSDDKKHLHLLAKIAHLSSKPESIELLLSKPSKEQLLDYIKNWESSISRTKN